MTEACSICGGMGGATGADEASGYDGPCHAGPYGGELEAIDRELADLTAQLERVDGRIDNAGGRESEADMAEAAELDRKIRVLALRRWEAVDKYTAVMYR